MKKKNNPKLLEMTKVKVDMINRMVDLLDDAIMSCYYGMIDEEKENTAITNYNKEKGRLNYYECLLAVIDYFLNDVPLRVDDDVKNKIDECLEAFKLDVEENGINSEEIRRAFLLLDIKGFKNLNFPLDLITPDAIGILIANLVNAFFSKTDSIEMLDFNFGVGNLAYTLVNYSDPFIQLLGIENHMLFTKVAVAKANMMTQDVNIYYEDALAYLPSHIDLIVSDLACYDYENKAYHSSLYDKGVRYFPYLAIEHFLKIPNQHFQIYLIENNFFSKSGSNEFYHMMKNYGHIDALITLPSSFFQNKEDAKSLIVISNRPLKEVETNIFMLPELSEKEKFIAQIETIQAFLQQRKGELK